RVVAVGRIGTLVGRQRLATVGGGEAVLVVVPENEVFLAIRQAIGVTCCLLDRGVLRRHGSTGVEERHRQLAPRQREGGVERHGVARRTNGALVVHFDIVGHDGVAVLAQRIEGGGGGALERNRVLHLPERLAHLAAQLAGEAVHHV